jgi:hypothetical protein
MVTRTCNSAAGQLYTSCVFFISLSLSLSLFLVLFSPLSDLDAIDPPGTVSITRAPFTHREAKVQDEMLGRQTNNAHRQLGATAYTIQFFSFPICSSTT